MTLSVQPLLFRKVNHFSRLSSSRDANSLNPFAADYFGAVEHG